MKHSRTESPTPAFLEPWPRQWTDQYKAVQESVAVTTLISGTKLFSGTQNLPCFTCPYRSAFGELPKCILKSPLTMDVSCGEDLGFGLKEQAF